MNNFRPGAQWIFGVAGLVFGAHVAAADIRDQLNVQTGKAEIVVPDMAPQNVAAQINDALSQWAIPANTSLRSLPSVIPARPDEPAAVQKYVNGAPAIEYQCGTAFAEITKRPAPINNAFMYAAEYIQACLYPFQKGVKVYLIFTSAKKTESLTSGLFNGITKAIRGDDGDWMTKQLNENIAAIRKNIPTLLVEKIEVPGLPVQEPDKAAVAALIPARVEAVAVPVPVAAVAPVAAAPAAPAPVATPGAAIMQAKIEARKNLNAMGMTYHSQEHFISAIRRKDDVAVQLFLDAGGIDPAAKEKGKTPAEVAQETGSPGIAKMILDHIAGKSTVPAAVAPAAAPANLQAAVKAPVQTAAPATAAAPGNSAADIAAAMAELPPEYIAELNQQLATMNMTEEQKEQMRVQAALRLRDIKKQLKSLTDRIDPATGSLR